MNRIKTAGLAALAALAAMALIGAGTASATVLCDTTLGVGNVCPAGHAYPANTTLEAHAEDVSLGYIGYGGTQLICETSDMTVTTTTAGGEGVAVAAEVEALSFQDCAGGGVGCTLNTNNLPYDDISIEYVSSPPDGYLTLGDSGPGLPGFSMTCGGAMECTYRIGEPRLWLAGGDPASVVAEEHILQRISGFGCREWGTWSATWGFTAPTAIYVADS